MAQRRIALARCLEQAELKVEIEAANLNQGRK
jgi:hypothetical protein